MKNFWILVFTVLFISGCEKSDLPENPDNGKNPDKNNTEETIKIEFHPDDKREGNIFELIEFNLYSDKSFTLYDLTQTYDSIIWKVSTLDGSLNLLRHSGNHANFTFKWSHNFLLPGEHVVTLHSYKDKQIIYADTTTISISNNKDFLVYNWEDITQSSMGSIGYQDALSGECTFATYHRFEDNYPSITFFPANSYEEEFSVAQKNKEFLLNYINSLYSLPTYTREESSSFEELYKGLFRNKKEDSQPLYIWITPKSKIVLLEYHKDVEEYYSYKIYVEPNR